MWGIKAHDGKKNPDRSVKASSRKKLASSQFIFTVLALHTVYCNGDDRAGGESVLKHQDILCLFRCRSLKC
jgi:hypothetical protein